jgi:hypothetical protein
VGSLLAAVWFLTQQAATLQDNQMPSQAPRNGGRHQWRPYRSASQSLRHAEDRQPRPVPATRCGKAASQPQTSAAKLRWNINIGVK